MRNKEIRGDQYVTLIVQTPTGLNSEAKELLRQFDEATGGSLTRNSEEEEKPKKKKNKIKDTQRSLKKVSSMQRRIALTFSLFKILQKLRRRVNYAAST